MGFSFRRSSSFGPFRLNFSQSGIGASVGVKGARVTLSSRGRTYITVGGGGFSYRQNLSSGVRPPTPKPRLQKVEAQPPAMDEIKTADVEELLASSKSELIQNLNNRAQMFNPASIFFVLAAVCAFIGLVQHGNSVSPGLPALPDVSNLSDTSRQTNRTDEYALVLARYGQPSAVTITQAGPVPLRTAAWADVHLAVSFIPAGCVDSYVYFETHKNDVAPTRSDRRHRTAGPVPPSCFPPTDKASTIVGYRDVTSGGAIDAGTAGRYLASLSDRSGTPPTVQTLEAPLAKKKNALKRNLQPGTVEYDETARSGEQGRLAEIDSASRKATRRGEMFLAGALLILVPGIVVHRSNREKRMTQLVYDLSAPVSAQQQALDESLGHLARSRVIWRLDSQSAVTDWKRNAGAAFDVKRERISVRKAVPPRVESNLVPMCVDLGKLRMYFLPDQVLYWQSSTFASIEYKDLKFEGASTRFIEEQVQTSDSKRVGSTWRYVRKDGGPDRRFNNNRELPVMLYGVITAVSSGGLNLVLHTSNVDAASSFTSAFRSFQNGRANSSFHQGVPSQIAHTEERRQTISSVPGNIEAAMMQLGVKPGVTLEQATLAYRHMAQMYHPDKASGLGPELQKLAEERMKEINAAHQVVRQYLERA
jgi:hypothetical protein